MKHIFKARCLVLAICLCLLCGVILWLRLTATEMVLSPDQHNNQHFSPRAHNGDKLMQKLFGHLLRTTQFGRMSASYPSVVGESVRRNIAKRIGDSEVEHLLSKDSDQLPDYNVHVFYYMWYGNPKFGGEYLHWNHPYLPHWNKNEDKKWPKGRHKPPEDIGSSFYPALGAYSSQDPVVVDTHMQQIRQSGAGVVAVSWYPPGMSDDNGRPVDPLIPLLLDAANKYHLMVCFHIEPYKERNADSLRKNLAYITTRYGNHPAFYRRQVGGVERALPVYYIYDAYLIPPNDWASLLRGTSSVRHTELDAIFISLLVESRHQAEILSSGFDGFYTYFASNGFTYGSTLHNWPALANFAAGNHLLFVPSVGPGYVDTSVRMWNGRSTRSREEGAYYERSWQAAVDVHPPAISVTSFNEWHEGTQIESASSQTAYGERNYLSYLPHPPDHYLKLTNKWVGLYRKPSKTSDRSHH